MEKLKQTLKSIIPHSTYTFFKKLFSAAQISHWEKKGCPVPPPHVVKQRIISGYQKQYNYHILVETGTFMGDMIEAQKSNFKKLYSIELSPEFHERAKKIFRRYDHINLLQGDSSQVLPQLIKQLEEPAIFWLDGHYSDGDTVRGKKNCPIYEELSAIFDGSQISNHVMLIDDANFFNGTHDYPTRDELIAFIKTKNAAYKVTIKDNIIRCTM